MDSRTQLVPNDDGRGQPGSEQARFGEWLANNYVAWSLFLSSYAPLLLIFAVRLSEKQQDVAFWMAVLAAVLSANVFYILGGRVAKRNFKVASVRHGSSEVAAYIATYLLPFLVVGDVGWRDLTAYALLVYSIGLVMTHGDALHVNPLLAILRLRLATITTADGAEYFVLSHRKLKAGDVVHGVRLRAHLYMER